MKMQPASLSFELNSFTVNPELRYCTYAQLFCFTERKIPEDVAKSNILVLFSIFYF